MEDPKISELRLNALKEYQIVDTPPEAAFDDITQLACYICGTQVALITLVEKDRQWFKSKRGITLSETPIDQAFCTYTILQPEVLVVPDTQLDARFACNPLVINEPHIRFYAGAPLSTPEGIALGSLCVIDSVPRTLSTEQVEALATLARHASHLLEQRRTLLLLTQTAQEKEAALHQVQQLQELLPVCSYCKKVRNDDDYWQEIETYISDHSNIQFTHGICPTCHKGVMDHLGKMKDSPPIKKLIRV